MITQDNKTQVKPKIDTLGRKITSSLCMYDVLWEHWGNDDIEVQETFKIIMLNNSNRIIKIIPISKGGLCATLVDLRVLFYRIINTLSTSIILAHNHPSGSLNPSEADKRLTEKIKNAAKLFDITVLDHIIITPFGEYYSFADNQLL